MSSKLQDLAIQVVQFTQQAVPREIPMHPFPGRLTQALSGAGIGQQFTDPAGEGLVVAHGGQQAGDAVPDHFLGPLEPGADHRKSGRHRLSDGIGEPLEPAGQAEYVGGGQEPGDVLPKAQQEHSIGQVAASQFPAKLRLQFAMPRTKEGQPRVARNERSAARNSVG